MKPDPAKSSDAEVIKLAEADHEAGVPDVQTAEASDHVARRADGTPPRCTSPAPFGD